MKISRRTQRLIRFQQMAFYLLMLVLIVLLSKLSINWNHQYDWTANSRHTLSDTSQQLLTSLQQDITIQVFVSPSYEFHDAIVELLDRYLRHTDKLKVNYIDPAFSPELVRQLNIQQQGEMVISLDEQQQHVQDLSEQSLTNAIISVSRVKQQWLVFIEGHGERELFEQNNFSLSTFAKKLQSQGFKLHVQNLASQPAIPDNTAAIVITSPVKEWLPGEIQLVLDYIEKGGNLLWLAEPEQPNSLSVLAERLGVEFIPGTVLDPNSAMLGIDDPRFVLVTDYANHPVGVATASVSLLADATAIQQVSTDHTQNWHYTNLLNSQSTAWVESNPVNRENLDSQAYDPGADVIGPVSLGYLLTRQRGENNDTQQRIAVIGDGDFASDSYIGNVANLDLAMALANWLGHDDQLIQIPIKTSTGTQLSLSPSQSMIIGLGFLLVLPLLLLVVGLGIWWRRKRQ